MRQIDVEKVFARLRREFHGKKAGAVKDIALSWHPEDEIQIEAGELGDDDSLRYLLDSLYHDRDPRKRPKVYSKKRYVGKLAVALKKVFREILHPFSRMILTRQANFNTTLVQLLGTVIEEFRQSLDEIKVAHDQLLKEVVSNRQELWQSLNTTREAHDKLLEGTISTLQTVNGKIKENLPRMDTLYYESIVLKANMARLLEQLERGSEAGSKADFDIIKQKQSIEDSSYYLFEEYHRGDSESLLKKQSEYLQYFRGKSRVLDVGCGRGEFLTLLKSEGIEGFGVDSNQLMVESCKEKGLNVECDDLISYLGRIEDGTFGGIFCSQVIEHLNEHQITTFLKLAWQKQESGGIIVLETLNPLSLTGLTNYFYKDMTHVRLIHPDTMCFLLKSCGYRNTEIKLMTPADDKEILKKLDDPVKPESNRDDIKILNENIQKLNDILFGFREYLAVAEK